MENERGWPERSASLIKKPVFLKLLSFNSLLRTYTCAGTALDADIRVDRVNIALADSADRAFSLTCAASDAFVFQNSVSHILRF